MNQLKEAMKLLRNNNGICHDKRSLSPEIKNNKLKGYNKKSHHTNSSIYPESCGNTSLANSRSLTSVGLRANIDDF